MLEEKYVRWVAFASLGFFALFVFVMLLYVFTPAIISLLSGSNYDYCYPSPLYPSSSHLAMGLTSLCLQTKTFLAMISMVLLVLAGFISLPALALGVLFLLQDPLVESGQKIYYLLLMLFASSFGVVIYLWLRSRGKEKK